MIGVEDNKRSLTKSWRAHRYHAIRVVLCVTKYRRGPRKSL
jgi:hypothetical protein